MSPLPAATTTRSLSSAYRSMSSTPALVKTSLPPDASKCSIQRGNLTRWSTERATRSSRAPQSIAFSPGSSGCGTASAMPSTGGHVSSQKSMPSARSWSSAAANMHWLEVTRPSWICSGVRSETTVTS